VRDLVVEAQGGEPSGDRRRPRAWRRIVVAADEYLLCAALGVSPGGLSAAFQGTFGISPHRFLKLRRMAMVRSLLHCPDGPVQLVKSVALSHGFWHLGQFAIDYRAMYGEMPSETLARAVRPRTILASDAWRLDR
jgi:AraC-like DNA-binding protein